MKNKINIEVCANSVESCIAAQKGGAYRVELCDNLYEGGTTPSAATVEVARKYINIKLNVIIRPRGGDFCYSDIEFEVMKKDIETVKKLGADGIVTGILKEDGNIDIERTKELIEIAQPMSVTFHRAFDVCQNPIKALDELIEMKVDRLLTSGQRNKATEGAELIAELVKRADGRIKIMPGSGVNAQNIKELKEKTSAKEFHLSGRRNYDSRMKYRKKEISMGGISGIAEYSISLTDAEIIKETVQSANTP